MLFMKALNLYMVQIVRKLILHGSEERDKKILQTKLVKTDGISNYGTLLKKAIREIRGNRIFEAGTGINFTTVIRRLGIRPLFSFL